MPAPMNFKLDRPTVNPRRWTTEEPLWLQLNQEIGGNPDFYPLTIKGAYVIGVIHGLCESVSSLLQSLPGVVALMPAYGVFASGLDLLGRCLNGNAETTNVVRDLKTGFNWISSLKVDDSDTATIATTSIQSYTVAQLVQLRHFASHGQATTTTFTPTFDYELLESMPALLANGLEGYWTELRGSDDFCNNLASANVLALRSWPVLRSWSLFEQKPDGSYASMTEIFSRMEWKARR